MAAEAVPVPPCAPGANEIREAPPTPELQRCSVDELRMHLESCPDGHKSCRQCMFAAGQLSKVNSPYARVEAQPQQASDLSNHSKNLKHIKALEALQSAQLSSDRSEQEPQEPELKHGIVSGLSSKVPRMDSWVAALSSILTRSSLQSVQDQSSTAAVASGLLDPQADASDTVLRKMLQCLVEPLNQEILFHMRQAVASSIAMDRGPDSCLVVYARILTKSGQIFDCHLGIQGDCVADAEEPQASRKLSEAFKKILLRSCTKRGDGRRSNLYHGEDDTIDTVAFDRFCDSVRSIVCDGCAVEQRAAFESSPLVGHLVGAAERQPLFPNCAMITRDRAHRVRSVQKLFFKKLPPIFSQFIDKLLTGKRSIATLLETSDKYSHAFLNKQKAARAGDADGELESGAGFSKLIKSLSFADHRFDSRLKPLFRLFKLLMIVLEMLQDIASGLGPWEADDREKAKSVLYDFSGDLGYITVVSAAVTADAMLLGSPFLRVCDQDNADYALQAPAAAKALQDMRHFLYDGAIWLPDARNTLTHTVLRAIKDRLMILRHNSKDCEAVSMRWPAPQSAERNKPVAIAREFLD
ncbi:unnamed protein product [Symbiodinium sp. CCMP2592]|nr:unnamed protein product [Symbiodinium sp. CCMP2592]